MTHIAAMQAQLNDSRRLNLIKHFEKSSSNLFPKNIYIKMSPVMMLIRQATHVLGHYILH